MKIDVGLKEFATKRQAEYVDAVNEHGGYRPAARAMGVKHSAVIGALKTLRNRAALRGYAPESDMSHTTPDTHYVKGTSTLYDEHGKQRMQWVKTNVKAEKLVEIAEQIVGSLAEDIVGISKPTPAPETPMEDLMAVYPMGDPHIGMYSWAEETGEDFDCDIAERDLQMAIDYLVEKAPNCPQALICNLGDFFHSDTMDNMTRRSGNVLDVDTRWARVMRVGIRIMAYVIDRALTKHQSVKVINEVGNHDDQSAYMLSLVLDSYYRDNPRVEIDLSPATFHFYRWHNCLFGVTHGHNVKMADLGEVMASDMAEDWGQTKHRYWYVGHIHHRDVKELRGCTVEAFRTLAGKDAWHASKGYRSGRDMMCIVHHKDHGEVSRHRFDISMIKKRVAA